jgi:hypothetical protein
MAYIQKKKGPRRVLLNVVTSDEETGFSSLPFTSGDTQRLAARRAARQGRFPHIETHSMNIAWADSPRRVGRDPPHTAAMAEIGRHRFIG